MTRPSTTVFIRACGLAALALGGPMAGAGFAQANPAKILDGSPRILVNGRQWSWGNGADENVFKAAGITNWTFQSGEYNSVPLDDKFQWTHNAYDDWWTQIDFRNQATPVILITYINTGKINGPGDTARINLEVRKLRMFADTLRARGVDWVIYTTRHKRLYRWNKPDAIDDATDTLVLKEYSRQLGATYHADVFTKTAQEFPFELADEFEHPGGPFHQVYTTRWLDAMYAHDGATPPAVLETNLDAAYAQEKARRAPLTWSIGSPAKWDTVRVGEKITMNVNTTDDGWVNNVGGNPPTHSYYEIRVVGKVGVRSGLFVVDSVPVTSKQMNFTFTIPDSAPVALYSYLDPNMYAVKADSAFFQILYNYWNGGAYQISKYFRLADRNGTIPVGLRGWRQVAQRAKGAIITAGMPLPLPDALNGRLVDPNGRLAPKPGAGMRPASGAWFLGPQTK